MSLLLDDIRGGLPLGGERYERGKVSKLVLAALDFAATNLTLHRHCSDQQQDGHLKELLNGAMFHSGISVRYSYI
jgi:hypothetical protein